jgi:hypothetical protein
VTSADSSSGKEDRRGSVRGPSGPPGIDATAGSRLNPLLIEGHFGGRIALEIEVPELPLATALQAYFDSVEVVPYEPRASTGPSNSLPYPDRTLDLVTL